jgi:hypothetical protein
MNSTVGRKLFYVAALVSQLITSCINSHDLVQTKSALETQNNTNEGELLFINLRFWKTTAHVDSGKVINTITTKGNLRDRETPAVRDTNHRYTIYLNSCKGNTLYKEEIDNPLDCMMEVYGENGKIELKKVNFKEREYSLKVEQGKEKICSVIVTKNQNKGITIICNQSIQTK